MNYVKDVVIEIDLIGEDSIKMYKETCINLCNKNIRNIRIIHISDIHYSSIKDINKLEHLYNKLSTYKANYICITGDLIHSNNVIENDMNYKMIVKWIKKLSKLSTILISLGNHDIYIKDGKHIKKYFNNKFWNELDNIENVHVLNNKIYKDDNINVYGYTQSMDYYFKEKDESVEILLKEIKENKINRVSKNKINVLLIHSPIHLNNQLVKEELKGYNLILSGHMHNGMILPIIDEIFSNNIGLISPRKKLFPKIARGIIKGDNIIMICGAITKFHSSTIPLIKWANVLFPVSINIININNKEFSKTFKYSKYI